MQRGNQKKREVGLSIVIPLFNEEKRFPNRLRKVQKILFGLKNTEIIFVNDGSRDNTLQFLKEISLKHKQAKVITYQKNRGKGFAVKKGVAEAKGEIISFMDADFSYSLASIEKFVNEINKGFDVVIADRSLDKTAMKNKPNILRRFLGNFLALVNNYFLDFGPIKDSQCGFKFFKKNVAKEIFPKVTIDRWLWDIQLIKLILQKKYVILNKPVPWEEVTGSKVNIGNDFIPVGKDLVKIYWAFFSKKMFLFLTFFIAFIFLLPFLIKPQNLTLRSGDFSDMVWPNFFFIKSEIWKGQIPLWNPTVFSGIPEIANPQSPLIYPPNYLAFILPMDFAIVILIGIHVIIGALFSFMICKDLLRWGNLASVVFSYGIVFSPFVWSKFAVGHLSLAFAILMSLPIIYFSIRYLRVGNRRNFLLLSLFLSLQYLNHPTHWYYSCLFGGLFVFYEVLFKRDVSKLIVLLASAVSLVIILPIFLIQIEAGSLSSRTSLEFSDLAIPIFSISRFAKSALLPSNIVNDLETEVWLYPSIVLILLATLGFKLSRFKYRAFSLIVVLMVVLITLGSRTPVFMFLNHYLPGFSNLRVTTRVWFVFVIVISFLGAFAIQKTRSFRVSLLLSILLLVDLLGFSMTRFWYVPQVMQPFMNKDLEKLLIHNEGRYYCSSRCLSPSWTLPKGIYTADGYHILILKSYRDALSDAGGFTAPSYTGNIPNFDDWEATPNAKKLGEFSIKWIISRNDLKVKDLKPSMVSGKYTLYENLAYLPRIRMDDGKGRIKILKDSPNEILVGTYGGGNLVLADSYYPGWEAYLDGGEVEIKRYQGWAKLIEVPQGEHFVKVKFNPFLGFK